MNFNLRLNEIKAHCFKSLFPLRGTGRFFICFFALGLFQLFSFQANAQVMGYNFASSSGTYTSLTGATVHSSGTGMDDATFSVTLPFTFNFNGTNYTQVYLSENGYVSFGSTNPGTTTRSAISSGNTGFELASALSSDLQGLVAGSKLSSQTIGSSPNRTFIAQWDSLRQYSGSGQNYSFQIQLDEANGVVTNQVVRFVYSTVSNTGSNTYEVGLRGTTNATYMNRTTTSNWASTTAGNTNNATCTVSSTVVPASGLTYTWTPLGQTYSSSTTAQASTAPVLIGATNQQILGIQVVVTGGNASIINLTNLNLNTTGTTSAADIAAAKVYYTGTSSTFATTTQFGSTVTSPSGTFAVSGSQALTVGTNYIWLAYDVAGGATLGNLLDGQCTQITVEGTNYTPTVTNPAGSRPILNPMSGTYTVGAGGNFTTLTAAVSAINAIGVGGATTFSLIDANYSTGETFPITINQFPGSSPVNTLTIKPASGVTATITGNSSPGVIVLNGADNIIIDGSNNGSTSRNLSVANTNTSAATAVISISSLGTGAGAVNNTIKNCNLSNGATNVVNYGISVGGATPGTTGADNDTTTIQNNIITSVTTGIYASGTTANSTGGLDYLTVASNSVSFNATISGCYGIRVAYSLTSFIDQNTISIETSVATMVGISLETGFISSTVSRNMVSKVKATSTSSLPVLRGITVATGQTSSAVTISNNVIYDVIASYSTTNAASNCAGIMIGAVGVSTSTTTTTGGINLYYNTINLSGNVNRSGACLQYGLFVGSGASSLNIRNNVISNLIVNVNATPGASKSYAVFSNAASSAYSTINNNCYYVSATQGVLGRIAAADVTSLSTFQTAFGQNANSISADPLFNSSTVLRPTASSPLLAAGTPIGGITTDFRGDTRSGTAPTIGAYEFGGEFLPPAVSFTPLGNTPSTSNLTLTGFATITDASGIDTASGTLPRLYYKKSTEANAYVGNTSSDNGWKWVEASNTTSPFNFTIDYSLLTGGSVAAGDQIQYFLVAQDLASTPNVGMNNGIVFSTTASSVALVAGNFPVTGFNNYNIAYQLSGFYNVGTGQQFTSLTNAGGLFEYLNNNVVSGDIVALVTSNLAETGAVALNQTSEYGGNNFTVTIAPSAQTTRTISGSYAGALIRLNGADRVIFDGRFNGSGSGNYLAFNNTATSGLVGCIQLISLGNGAGAMKNTIRNCTFYGAKTATSIAIAVGGTLGATGSDNDSLLITNNVIRSGAYGIYVGGNVGNETDMVTISNNTIGQDTIVVTAIFIANIRNFDVSSNTITNIVSPSTTNAIAISLPGNARDGALNRNIINNVSTNGGNAFGIRLQTGDSNVVIKSNKINGVLNAGTGAYGGKGIDLNTALTNSNILVINNFVSGISGDGWYSITSDAIVGIRITGTMGGVKVWNNSVSLSGIISRSSTTDFSAALGLSSTVTDVDVRNNIFRNSIFNVSGTQTSYAIYNAAAASAFSTIGYNNYLATGAQAALGFQGSSITSLSSWKTLVTADATSQATGVNFVDTLSGDLRLTGSSNGDYYLRALRIAANDVDIDNTSRTPITYMGAHQASTALNMTVNAGNDTTVCAGTGVQLGGSNIVTGGIATYTYSWSPSLSAVSNPTATPTTTTQYVVTVTDNLGFTATDSVIVTVNPSPAQPIVTVPSVVCSGTTANLSATGTGTLNWYDVATGGVALTTGSNYTTPALNANDTFWVDASQSGCSSSRKMAIVQVTIPVNPTASAPSPICAGNTVNLTASVGSGILTWYKNASGGTALGTGSPYTTSVLNANDSFYVSSNLNGCMSSRVMVNVTVNGIPSSPTVNTPSPICAGTNTIITTTATGTKKWYTASGGGTSIYTGDTLTTPVLTANTTYYADNTVNGCVSINRTPVTVSVNPIPALPAVTAVSICEGSTATLTATGFSTGDSINWYDAATAGNLVGSGPTYTSGVLTAGTSTFYAGITSTAGCTNASRTPGVVTVNVIPSAPVVTGTTVCEATSATLDFSALAGILKWYNDSVGTTPSYTGNVYSSATMSANDTFYISTTVSGCESSRNQLVIEVTPLPAKPVSSNTAVCEGHPATLSATGSSPIAWYLSATGGASVDTGNSIIVNGITSTTVYFAESHNGVCASATRTPVVVVFNAKPDAAFTVLGQLAGQVTFKANALSGVNYNWNFGNSTTSTVASPTCVYATNGNYNVKLVVLNPTTGCSDSTTTNVTVGTVGTGNKLVNGMMASAYPNPFENNTTIDYTISQAAVVSVKIVDLMGREVMDIPAEQQQAGNYHINWNSEHLSAGVYYVRLNINGQDHTLRLVKAQK